MKSPKYEYLCEDKSVLYPILKKYVWAPSLPYLPEWMSPNSVTLAGNFFAWVAFAILLVLQPEDSTWFLVPALFNFLYLSLDNMDGMQARRAGRSSPLGEFLDHWFDGFNTGLMVFGFGIAMRVPPWFLLMMLSLVCIAYFSIFWEQQVTGKLNFGSAGSIEGIIYIVLMYLLVAFVGHGPIASDTILGPLTLTTGSLLVVGFFFVLTAVTGMLRVGRRWADFLPHIIVYSALGTWFAAGELPLLPACFMVLLAGAYLGGRAVVARVLGEPLRGGDPILYFLVAVSMAVSLGAQLDGAGHTYASVPVIVYLFFRLATDFSRTVSAMRHHLVPREFLARIFKPAE